MFMSPAPFLSVITRTQGKRPHTLAEVLTCLAAQTDTDFELLVIGHRLDQAGRAAVDQVIADAPHWLAAKIRLILVEDGTRTRPLNAGLRAARGDYIAVLDDDDAVFAHWVETFHGLARASPGRMLRALTARQTVDTVMVQGALGLRAEGPPERLYPARFNFFDHVLENRSPTLSLAFPRAVIAAHGIGFDESLTTTEDWDFMMRVACAAGVAEVPEVTSIYRWWKTGESSRTLHDDAEWRANHQRIWDNWNAAPFPLPAGMLAELTKLLQEHADFRAELRRLRHEGVTVAPLPGLTISDTQPLLHAARRELAQILSSTSWRVTAPLRWLQARLGIIQPFGLADIAALDAEQAEARVLQLRQSASWRLSKPVRALRRWRGRR